MTKTKLRIYAAWTLLIGAIIGWPLSQLTIAREEPPFILALSWLAIILTAADLVTTTHVSDQDNKQEGKRFDRMLTQLERINKLIANQNSSAQNRVFHKMLKIFENNYFPESKRVDDVRDKQQ